MRGRFAELLREANAAGGAVPGFNVFGHEDALGVLRAAESLGAPVILATNREMVEYMGVRQAASMLGLLAEEASVPVCVHLDHCHDVDLARRAIDAGYDSVMYDGSTLSLADNIRHSATVAAHARDAGVGVEGEIGSVAYSPADNRGREHVRQELTEPGTAHEFAQGSGVDAVAVSVGNVHRLETPTARIDFERLARVSDAVDVPLVIHGTSGIDEDQLVRLAARTPVAKFNVGTSLRRAFARGLRAALASRPDEYDRLTLFADVIPEVSAEARRYLELLGGRPAG